MNRGFLRILAALAAFVAAGVFRLYAVPADAADFPVGGGRNPDKHISFIHLSVSDGLSQCTVLSCTQDTSGRMWFATLDGLNRYDGYDFRTWRHSPDDSTSIASNIIRKVYVDRDGQFWAGTGRGLSYYDARADVFRNFHTGERTVTGIADAGNGKLMVVAGGDLQFFDKSGMRWAEEDILRHSGRIRGTILLAENERIWIGTESDGVFCWSSADNSVRKIFSPAGIRPVQCLYRKGNELWVATEGGGLWRYDMVSDESECFLHNAKSRNSISSNYVRALAEDSFGRLWVGTYNGLSIYENGGFTNVVCNPFTEGSLSQSSVRCIKKDNQGGMWLGTYFGGLNYWHPLMNRFSVMRREPGDNALNDNVVSCISEDSDGIVWIGTNSGGLNRYDPVYDSFSHYLLSDNGRTRLESDDIKSIFVDDRSGTIYVGAHAGGLSRIDKRARRLIPYNYTGDILDVYSIVAAPEGRIWVGTLKGLKLFDPVTSQFTDCDCDADGNGLGVNQVRALMNDDRGRLWVGTENGLSLFEIDGRQLRRADLGEGNAELLDGAFVQSLCQTTSGLVWVGTREGLFCWNPESQSFSGFTSVDGLPSDIVSGMEEDRFGRLWVSTDRGLCCFNHFSGQFRNYTFEDGLPGNQFNPGAHLCRSNGEMMFGGVQGITRFRPESIEDNPFTPKPLLTSLWVSGQEVRPGDSTGILSSSLALSDNIELSHGQNSIRIDFTVPNYLSWHHNTFAYRLEGYDDEWHVTHDRSLTMSNLPPGKYRLSVKAANNDGKWNEEPVELGIRVHPVWYGTVWAKLLLVLLAAAMMFAVSFFFIRRKEEENRLELARQDKEHSEDMHQMKMRFYINISHEMRTPLTLIINPLSEMIAHSSDSWMRRQLRYLERNARRLLHLVNQLLDYRRAELDVFKLKVRQDDAYKIIKENCAYYDKLALRKKLKYTVVTNLEGRRPYVDGQYLELILSNLLSNAFSYTDEGRITVSATLTPDNLVLEVSDTGIGIPEADQEHVFERYYRMEKTHTGSGIGLSLVQRLVELHHGTITLQSEVGKGSTFTVIFPQNPDLYSEDELSDGNEPYISANTKDMYLIDAAAESEEQPAPDEEPSTDVNLLLVEDNDELRDYTARRLMKYFNLQQAVNGADAIEKMNSFMPDVIVTDLTMPVMDGLKLCSYIKHNAGTGHIPVIVVSTRADSESNLEALKAGADDFMTKPVSISLLIVKIRNLIRTITRTTDKAAHNMDISPERISFNALDEQILNKAVKVVESHMDNAEFSTEQFASEMNMSRSNLHLKLKAITGESALDFIRKVRFKEACRLLEDGRYSISEISDKVGFSSPSYFTTCFKKYMGCLPTEWTRKYRGTAKS